MTEDGALFMILNICGAICSLCGLVAGFVLKRHFFIKPSVFFLVIYHFLFQWPSVFLSEDLVGFLPSPWFLPFWIHGFAIISLFFSFLFLESQSRLIWNRIQNVNASVYLKSGHLIVAFLVLIGILTSYYLTKIPLSQTGLYANIFAPENAMEAREDSLKRISDPLARYGFMYMASSVCLLASSLVTIVMLAAIKCRKWHTAAGCLMVMIIAMSVSSLTGARSFSAVLLFCCGLTVALQYQFRVVGRMVLVLPAACLVIPTVLTLLRGEIEINPGVLFDVMVGPMMERTFLAPLEVGSWYVHHAQSVGFVGLPAIERLAMVLGIQPLNMPNLIGLLYTNYGYEFINANAGFVLSYYAYFGLGVFPLLLVATQFLDLTLVYIAKLHPALLIPTIATLCTNSHAFAVADYTQSVITHGFLFTIVTSVVLSRIKVKRSQSPPMASDSANIHTRVSAGAASQNT